MTTPCTSVRRRPAPERGRHVHHDRAGAQEERAVRRPPLNEGRGPNPTTQLPVLPESPVVVVGGTEPRLPGLRGRRQP